jgi:elongator complex protein 3
LYQEGKYQPISTEEILSLIKEIFQTIIPPYTRIKRLIRDIPAPEIVAGSSITNLSQLVHEELLKVYQQHTDSPIVQAFYQRLYEDNEFLQTIIIGTAPDLTSYRNFVSLDTRSREVKNKTISREQLP